MHLGVVQIQEEHEQDRAKLESQLRSLQDDLRVVTAKLHQSQVGAKASPLEPSAWRQFISMHMQASFCYASVEQDRQAPHEKLHRNRRVADARATQAPLLML